MSSTWYLSGLITLPMIGYSFENKVLHFPYCLYIIA